MGHPVYKVCNMLGLRGDWRDNSFSPMAYPSSPLAKRKEKRFTSIPRH